MNQMNNNSVSDWGGERENDQVNNEYGFTHSISPSHAHVLYPLSLSLFSPPLPFPLSLSTNKEWVSVRASNRVQEQSLKKHSIILH